jgi:hypothetical protein
MKHQQKAFPQIRVPVLLVFCTAVLLLLPASGSAAQATSQAAGADQSAAKPSLAGTWKLNKDQSDDPHQKMQQAMGGSGEQGGGHGWGGRGHGGGREGSEHGRGGMMNDLSQLTIQQTDSTVKVTDASGRVLAVYPSDQGNSTKSSGNGDGDAGAPASAQWQGNQLVAVTQGTHGGKATRTYALSPDGSQLYVTTRMESKRFNQPVSFRLVYDPVKSNGGGTP